MYRAILENGPERKVILPDEICRRCGFSPHQEVAIEERRGILIVREAVPLESCPQTIDELFALPPGALASRALGGEGSGDFDEQDID